MLSNLEYMKNYDKQKPLFDWGSYDLIRYFWIANVEVTTQWLVPVIVSAIRGLKLCMIAQNRVRNVCILPFKSRHAYTPWPRQHRPTYQELPFRFALVKYTVLSCAPLFSVKDSKMYVTIYAIPLKLKTISLLWGKQGKQNVIFLFGKHYLFFGGFFVSIIFLSVYLKVHAVLITVSLWFHNRNISQIFYLSFWGNISNVATCIFESLKSLVSWFCLLAC